MPSPTRARDVAETVEARLRFIQQAMEPAAPVEMLREHPRNPRVGNLEVIEESIEENGFYGAVVAQRSTGHILRGNHTYRKAVEMGATTIPVIWLDVDDGKALSILLADNKTHEGGGYDNAILQAVLHDHYASAGTLQGTGYTDEDWQRIMGEPFESFTGLPGGLGADGEPLPPESTSPGESGSAESPIIIPPRWDVLIECADEAEQVRLLEELSERGLRVRALVS
jgi:hypothetical protein